MRENGYRRGASEGAVDDMLVISPDAAYVLKPDGSTLTVERPDVAPDPKKRPSKEKRPASRPR